MKNELNGVMVFDASVIIDFLIDEKIGKYLRERIIGEVIIPYTPETAVLEVKYVLCRLLGYDQAIAVVNNFLSSGYLLVEPINDLIDIASKYKRYRAISLPDALVLSLANRVNVPALFARREKEIISEMKKKPFNVQILFLEDFV